MPEQRVPDATAGSFRESRWWRAPRSILRPKILPLMASRSALILVKEDSLHPELLSEDPILRYEVLNSVLLSTIDPAREDHRSKNCHG